MLRSGLCHWERLRQPVILGEGMMVVAAKAYELQNRVSYARTSWAKKQDERLWPRTGKASKPGDLGDPERCINWAWYTCHFSPIPVSSASHGISLIHSTVICRMPIRV